jgi:hypothetical protein
MVNFVDPKQPTRNHKRGGLATYPILRILIL